MFNKLIYTTLIGCILLSGAAACRQEGHRCNDGGCCSGLTCAATGKAGLAGMECQKFEAPAAATTGVEMPSSIQCASDYGTSAICCGQEGNPSGAVNQCPSEYPVCQNYIYGSQWGSCFSNAAGMSAPAVTYRCNTPSKHYASGANSYTSSSGTTSYCSAGSACWNPKPMTNVADICATPEQTQRAQEARAREQQAYLTKHPASSQQGCRAENHRCTAGSCCATNTEGHPLVCTRKHGNAEPVCKTQDWCAQNPTECEHQGKGINSLWGWHPVQTVKKVAADTVHTVVHSTERLITAPARVAKKTVKLVTHPIQSVKAVGKDAAGLAKLTVKGGLKTSHMIRHAVFHPVDTAKGTWHTTERLASHPLRDVTDVGKGALKVRKYALDHPAKMLVIAGASLATDGAADGAAVADEAGTAGAGVGGGDAAVVDGGDDNLLNRAHRDFSNDIPDDGACSVDGGRRMLRGGFGRRLCFRPEDFDLEEEARNEVLKGPAVNGKPDFPDANMGQARAKEEMEQAADGRDGTAAKDEEERVQAEGPGAWERFKNWWQGFFHSRNPEQVAEDAELANEYKVTGGVRANVPDPDDSGSLAPDSGRGTIELPDDRVEHAAAAAAGDMDFDVAADDYNKPHDWDHSYAGKRTQRQEEIGAEIEEMGGNRRRGAGLEEREYNKNQKLEQRFRRKYGARGYKSKSHY